MENKKKEKAIEQAVATLAIDKIYLSEDFLKSYLAKCGIATKRGPVLVKRSSNGKK